MNTQSKDSLSPGGVDDFPGARVPDVAPPHEDIPTPVAEAGRDRRQRAPWRALAVAVAAATGLAAWGVGTAGDDGAAPPISSATTVSPDLSGVHERLVDYLDGRVLEANGPVPCVQATSDLPHERVADYLDGRILDTSGRALASPFC